MVQTGLFRYAVIDDAPDLHLFSQPLALNKLLMFLVDAYNEIKKDKLSKQLPCPAFTARPICAVGVVILTWPSHFTVETRRPCVLCSYVEKRKTYLCVGGTGQV